MKLKAYIKWQGLTAQQFAEDVDVSHTTINNLCDGTHKPRRPLMCRIIKKTKGRVGLAAFDLPKNYLTTNYLNSR